MPFLDTFTLFGSVKPARIYFHKTGYNEAFGSDAEDNPSLGTGICHVVDIMEKYRGTLQPADFLISMLWGEDGIRTAEVFGYGDITEWPGNPTVYNWVFRNGVHCPDQRQISCGDTLIVLGEEEKQRRHSKDFLDYITKPPKPPADLLLKD
jgi:hypothetical protein